ncbi:MAG TPA: tol-pal system-associated acyl-CoA thioesterase [Rhodospirillaceae bacterium]|nr:tol-pal system-associated acyl-CoA thioesterase [Rhodospirillaceae bacterium]HAA92556.1 tol-pal system-associated acyl-CoA thioesterase [Rhodospirillaceae bacterium]HAT34923.1 tol-pal system-associated acyl-CoA thioesterase [Rhodospirillaceae bacterium]|tara:strand:- start:282 stop:701 length:420 start_codon:yes stop_codon:yes gene_type:complete
MTSAPHVFPFRVYYEDTDAGGVVYYANYLKFAERARSEFLRSIGTGNSQLMADFGVLFAVSGCNVKYRRPAKLDDMLEVHTELTKVGGATMSAAQTVRRDGESLVEMNVDLACLNEAGRPVRLPQSLRAALEATGQSEI